MDVINFLNTTCTLLLNKQQALVWGLEGPFRGLTCPLGLEPSLILQAISVFFSFIIGCKVFSINLFNYSLNPSINRFIYTVFIFR